MTRIDLNILINLMYTHQAQSPREHMDMLDLYYRMRREIEANEMMTVDEPEQEALQDETICSETEQVVEDEKDAPEEAPEEPAVEEAPVSEEPKPEEPKTRKRASVKRTKVDESFTERKAQISNRLDSCRYLTYEIMKASGLSFNTVMSCKEKDPHITQESWLAIEKGLNKLDKKAVLECPTKS